MNNLHLRGKFFHAAPSAPSGNSLDVTVTLSSLAKKQSEGEFLPTG